MTTPRTKVAGSGRKKGTPNRVTPLRDVFVALNFDPMRALVDLLPTLDPVSRAKTLVALLPYLHAPVRTPEAEDEEKKPSVVVHLSTEALSKAAEGMKK